MAILSAGFTLCVCKTVGQVTIALPQANIQSRADYNQIFNVGQYSSVLTLLPTFRVKANTTSFSSTAGGSVPLSIAHIKLNSIGSLSLLGASSEVTLSVNNGNLYSSLATVSSGAITANVRLSTGSQTWIAGIYDSNLSFSTQGVLAGSITPTTLPFSISVPGFISPPVQVGTTSILVNNLSFYRSANGISTAKVIPLTTTVPYIPSLKTTNTQFSFNTALPYNSLPSSPVSAVNTTLTGISTATTIALSTTDQALTNTTGIAVPANNAQSITANYSINASQLKTSFIQSGTYSVPLTHTWSKLANAYPIGALQAQSSGNLEIVVSDLAELVANQQAVSLDFGTTADYKNGISKDMSTHLRISKTTPYNLYVRASSASFISGTNSIPLNVLRIGPMANQTGINTITLSTSAQQLIQSADPVIDRNLNIRYSIPASETSKLLNKPAGTYTANIIFSFVAP